MKYEITDETRNVDGVTLHRIKAVRDIEQHGVKAGDLGGWIERESNLSQDDNARVCGDALVSGDARVFGDAQVYGNADYMVFKNSWSSGRFFTYTRSNKMWKVGCFHGTGEELVKKAYADSESSGRCYEAIVKAVEAIEAARAGAKGKTE